MTSIKPKQKRSAARYDQLLHAAADLIVENGMRGFALSAVAKRTGISQGSLYQYFSSKDAILIALHKRYAAQFLDTLNGVEADLGAGCPTDLVARLVRLVVKSFAPFYQANPAYAELRRHASFQVQPVEDDLDLKIVAVLTRILTVIQPALKPDHASLRAEIFLEIADALLLRSGCQNGWDDETERALTAYLFAGLEIAPGA